MNFDVYIFLRFVMIFHNFLSFLCSVLRVSSKSDPSHRDLSVSVPAESAAETATLNHEFVLLYLRLMQINNNKPQDPMK